MPNFCWDFGTAEPIGHLAMPISIYRQCQIKFYFWPQTKHVMLYKYISNRTKNEPVVDQNIYNQIWARVPNLAFKWP